MLPRTAAPALAFLALAAMLGAALPATAHGTEPALHRLSYDPVPGDYTLIVGVENVALAPANATADAEGMGRLHYLLNGFPCEGDCARGQPYRTNATHFTYHRLVTGDEITVELRNVTGTPLAPAVRLDVTVAPSARRCAEGPAATSPAVDPEACARWETVGPFLAITSGIPNAGDYTMRLTVDRFTLVPPREGEPGDIDTGYILYTLNGDPCLDDCSGGAPAASTSTSFTFHDVEVGDRLGARLLRPDGSPLAPPREATVFVARPSIGIVSGVPQEQTEEGDRYTMRVVVRGFTLVPPGTDDNAGAGHIVYLVRKEGTATFVRASCDAPAATTALTYRFCGLEEGDQVTAELVTTRGEPLSPKTTASSLAVLRKPVEPLVTPGVGPLVGLLLVALAAARRP